MKSQKRQLGSNTGQSEDHIHYLLNQCCYIDNLKNKITINNKYNDNKDNHNANKSNIRNDNNDDGNNNDDEGEGEYDKNDNVNADNGD